jgi:hypothetical protein
VDQRKPQLSITQRLLLFASLMAKIERAFRQHAPDGLLALVLPKEFDMDVAAKLTAAIQQTVQQWIDKGLTKHPKDINCGMAQGGCCDDFVSDVYETLGGQDVAYDEMGLSELGIDNLMIPDEDFTEGRPFDRELLAEHWPNVQPTQGLTWDDLDQLSEDAGFFTGTHVWITVGGRHYDAECPEGVDNLFELPFFERVIESWNADRAMKPR